jgi:predicted PurR-regulated permease PerM
MIDPDTGPWIRRIILAVLLGGLLLLGYEVLKPFLVPVAWAVILSYVTWPMHARLRRWLGGSAALSALLMTFLLTAAFVLPLLWLVDLLRGELGDAYQAVAAYLANGPPTLPEFLRRIPWLGERLQEWLSQVSSDPAALRAQMTKWGGQWVDEAGRLVGGVGRNAVKLGFALLTLFFLYRDGEKLLDQVRRVLEQFLGERVRGYLLAVGATTKAVVYGLVLTALAQGFLAGLGYWGAGVKAPAALGALTALIALIPFGTPLVWGSIGIWLLLTGQTLPGIGLLAWGILVVSWVDNLIRPLVISTATRIPFVLVMFGVLGGVTAFGLVGLFLGPVILAVLMAVWREWLEAQTSARDASP